MFFFILAGLEWDVKASRNKRFSGPWDSADAAILLGIRRE